MSSNIIYIGCDSSGYEAKTIVLDCLAERGYTCVDCGSGAENSRYPYYAAKVASAVAADPNAKGILICATGVGMAIAANKFKGVRAALISDAYTARITRRHNNSNVLCLAGKMLGRWMLNRIVEVWLTTEYDGGHHQPSLDLISQMEECMFNGNVWCPEDVPYEHPFSWNPNQTI